MTATLEAPVEEPTVTELTDDTRQELVALRESGMTLAELKVRFPQLTGEQIRSVLPPANARERKQRESAEARATRQKAKAVRDADHAAKLAEEAKVTETAQGVGGRSGAAKSSPKAKTKAEEPKQPKYVDDVELSQRVLAARQVMGRKLLAEALSLSESATWRAERDRVTPDEAGPLRTALVKVEERITAGEFKKATREPKAAAPTKADLTHRVEVVVELLRSARSDKGITKAALVDSALAVLNPTDASKA